MAQFGPLGALLNALAQWVWGGFAAGLAATLQVLVFRPLTWPVAATSLFALSRTTAWACMGLALAWAVMGSMWPGVMRRAPGLPTVAVERALVGAALVALWQPAVEALVAINNGLVAALTAAPPAVGPAVSPAGALWSPVLALALALLAMGLLGYLTVFYALRSIEIWLLLAVGPWVAVAWVAFGHDGWMHNYWREMTAAIFVQAAHAMAFWLFSRLLLAQAGGLGGAVAAAGTLWYMAALPAQLRRLLGAPAVSAKGWRWL